MNLWGLIAGLGLAVAGLGIFLAILRSARKGGAAEARAEQAQDQLKAGAQAARERREREHAADNRSFDDSVDRL